MPQEIDGEFILDALLMVIYSHFPEAKWRIGNLETRMIFLFSTCMYDEGRSSTLTGTTDVII